METPDGAVEAAWRRTTTEHGSNMGSKRYQRSIQMEDPEEFENRAPAAAGAQFSTWYDTPSGASKLGRSPEA